MRKKLLLLFALLVSTTMAWGQDGGYCGDPDVNGGANVTWNLTDGVLTISGTGAMADYDDLENCPWYFYCDEINSVIIGAGVTHIGSNAFSYISVSNVCFAEGSQLETIGSGAFNGSGNLKSIAIPNGVTDIQYGAFLDCGVESVILPSSVTTLWGSMFENSKLTSITCWGTTAPTLEYDNLHFASTDNPTLYTLSGATGYDASGWPTTTADIPNTLTATPVTGTLAGNWCTYYNSYTNAQVDDNTKVYTVSVSGNNATLTEVEDKIIKAGQGVVLKSTASTITLTYTTDAATDSYYTNNQLKGVDIEFPKSLYTAANSGAQVYYTLARVDTDNDDVKELGFFNYSGTTLGANKAFIALESAASARGFTFTFDEEETTGISDVRSNMSDGIYYDLQGRRVAQPTKGLYIKDGKKIMVK